MKRKNCVCPDLYYYPINTASFRWLLPNRTPLEPRAWAFLRSSVFSKPPMSMLLKKGHLSNWETHGLGTNQIQSVAYWKALGPFGRSHLTCQEVAAVVYNNIHHLLNNYYVSGASLSILIQLLFTTILWGKEYDYTHFTDEETKAHTAIE